MHRKIQVVGLPGSGKTTGIQKYCEGREDLLLILDIRNFCEGYRKHLFRKVLESSNIDTIAESACGINSRSSFIVRLDTPIQRVYDQLLERDKVLDEDYISLLSTQIVPAHYTVSDSGDLPDVLHFLLGD